MRARRRSGCADPGRKDIVFLRRRHEGRAPVRARATPGPARRIRGAGKPTQASRTAFIEMAAFISFEIGQPVLALFAAVSNAAWLAPGTPAVTSR